MNILKHSATIHYGVEYLLPGVMSESLSVSRLKAAKYQSRWETLSENSEDMQRPPNSDMGSQTGITIDPKNPARL